jgi:hypothetical protein
MVINPQSFFNFAAQNYLLLHDIFRKCAGMNDAELTELIRRHHVGLDTHSPHSSHDFRSNGNFNDFLALIRVLRLSSHPNLRICTISPALERSSPKLSDFLRRLNIHRSP